MMTEEEKLIYAQVRQPASYNADCAIDIYIERITPLCPKYPNISHALLRIAADPMFCMEYCEANEMKELFIMRSQNDIDFLRWLEQHLHLVELCAKELAIRFFFSSARVIITDQSVILDFERDAYISETCSYYNKLTENILSLRKEFHHFQEFHDYFSSFFTELSISQEEVDLNLYELEDMENKINRNNHYAFLRTL